MGIKRLLAALALLATLAFAPGSVQAVSCAPLAPGLPQFEMLVRGRLDKIPARGVARITVSRYFKGSGPAILIAEVSGIGQGQREDWGALPRVGDEVVAALRREGTALRNTMCNPFVILAPGAELPNWVTSQFGQGIPPDPSVPPMEMPARSIPRAWLIGGAAAAGLLLVLAIRAIRR